MTVKVRSTDSKGKTRSTKLGKPKPAFQAVVAEGELLMNFSWASSEAEDSEGNKVKVHVWINGDWKVEYKGREFVIPMSDNINALIEWINKP